VTVDGRVLAWGANGAGQLGRPGVDESAAPALVDDVNRIVDVSAGNEHSLALREDGSLWAWGGNDRGQLGTSDRVQQDSPVRLASIQGVVAIAAGGSHSVALLRDGSVWAWGSNDRGEIAAGGEPEFEAPQLISSSAVAIAAGDGTTAVLQSDGSILQLGSGPAASQASLLLSGTALFVVGNTNLGSGDLAVKNRLQSPSLGLTVTVVKDSSSTTAMATGKTVVVISSTVSPTSVNTKFRDVAVPVVTWESAIFDDMKMTGTASGTDFGTTTSQTQVAIATPSHPLAAGLTGTVAVSASSTFDWGVVAATGVKAATIVSNTSRATVFGYELGSTMVGLAAPARRVGLFLFDTTAASLTANGWSLFDAAINWATTPPKVPTPAISPGSGTYTTAQTVTITCSTCPTGTTLRYTTNGTTPTSSSPVYSAPFSVSTATQVQARGFKQPGWVDSDTGSATLTFNYGTRPQPSISPAPGTYFDVVQVSITASAGDEIRYTTNGSTPTQSSALYTGPFTLDYTATVKAVAFRVDWTQSPVATATYTMAVGTPTLSPPGGSYGAAQSVTVTTVSPGADLHYTLNGGEPTQADATIASGSSILIAHSLTLKVAGWRTGWSTSGLATGTYLLSLGTAATPILSPAPATFTSSQTVSMSTATNGAVIRYTTDGTDPDFRSPLYSSPVVVSRTAVVKARAFAADMTRSAVAGGLYRIDTGAVDPPRFSPGAGQYVIRQLVTVTSETPDAVIHYRLDGADPNELDPMVASGSTILVDQNTLLRARAYKAGLPDSAVTAADYRVTGAVALGSNSTFALKADGTVSSWGSNSFQSLGDPAIASGGVRTTPGRVANLADIVAVAAGADHGLALKNDGTVWSWGRNSVGQLGDGTATQRAAPVQVLNLTGVIAIAAGGDTSLAVKDDGSVWTWGSDLTSIGYGNGFVAPVQVAGLAGVTTICMGGSTFAAAVQTDGMPSGTLWAWGNNQSGQLGDGTATNRANPVSVAQDVLVCSGGGEHALALKPDGTVLAWGRNSSNQLGDGTFTTRYRPTAIPSFGDAVAIAAGGTSGMAVKGDGSVWSWGDNYYGQLGDGTGTQRPVPVLAAVVEALAIAGSNTWGSGHSASVQGDGRLWTWGKNDTGALGDGTTTTNATPKAVPAFALFFDDVDRDGVSASEEGLLGTNPNLWDTNGDGLPDGLSVRLGISPTSTDVDGDGVLNSVENAQGTDPFTADTDGDGVNDASDCAPLDSTRSTCVGDPNDHTPPVITLDEPAGAVPIP
jgi:alpha-tubulin suppressor-like RCC1 family protein